MFRTIFLSEDVYSNLFNDYFVNLCIDKLVFHSHFFPCTYFLRQITSSLLLLVSKNEVIKEAVNKIQAYD